MNKVATDKQHVFLYLRSNIATAAMVAKALDIPHQSVCKYKRELQNEGLLYELYRHYCLYKGNLAWFITTNPQLIPKRYKQTKIFR